MQYSHDGIEIFVRQTLGCTCPEEVFQHIEQASLAASVPEIPGIDRILIGRKLLIYVWELSDLKELEQYLPALVTTGKQERNLLGYNRFRLVVLTQDPPNAQVRAEELFAESASAEPKLHLHVVNKNAATQVLQRPA